VLTEIGGTLQFVSFGLKVVMQNDQDFVDIILMYLVRNLGSTPTDQHIGECCSNKNCPCARHESV
jgi:hypothetical protein